MTLGEVLAAFGLLMGIIGVPVGMLYRQNVRNTDAHIAALLEDCARAIADLKESHTRELAARDREIADRDRRLEAANVTEARLIEMALRTTVTGERAATVAEVAIRGKAP